MCSTETPGNTLLQCQETTSATQTRAEMILTCVALNLPPFYTSSITGDLFITQLNTNTPHYDQESPKHVGNYPSLSEEV